MQSRYLAATAIAVLLVASHARAEAPANGVLVYPPSFFADARPNTAYDMIGRLPGFTFSDVGSARGFAGTAGNVLIDGQRPTSKTDSLESVLKRILAADIDHIELIRGGAPGIDMQGQTVVANVVLKKQDSTRFVATAEDLVFLDGHMIPYGALQFTRHTDGSIYEGSISSIQNYDDSVGHGKHFVFDGLGNLIQNDEAISHGLGIGFAAKGSATVPLWGGEFRANFTYQNSPFVDRLSYAHPGFLELFKDNSRDNNGELGLHWKGPVGPVELETLALQRLGHNNSSSDADDGVTLQHFTSAAATGETIARATVRYLPSPGLTIEGGAEGAYNYLDGKTAFFINGVDQPLPSATARVEERRGEVFFQGTWRFDPDWVLEAGARAEFSTISESGSVSLSRSFFYPKPRIVLTWSPDKDTQLRLRYEKVVGQLDFNNFIASANLSATGVTVGNENLRPDQHSQFEISLERHFWGKGAVVLTYMHEKIKDVVDFVPIVTPTATFDAPGNIGNGSNEQFTVQLTLPLDAIYVPNGLLTTTSIFDISSVRDPVTGEKRVISGQRPQNIKVNFSQDIDSLKSTWGIFYYNCWDEKYFRLAQVRHRKVLPPYLGVSWDWKPSDAWTFHAEADDIVGFVYDDKKFNYAGPRNVAPLDNIDEYRANAIPQIDFQVRYTF
ncbi:MAG TPA: TonB-dependent receptor [Rhizomicrobium sp.]|nr:TonB-dependent receptor [Rhizomicrobium sp.]